MLAQGIGVAFKQPVIILHLSFRAISTCPVCLKRPPLNGDGDAKWFRKHVVSTWLSAAYDSCSCCKDRLGDASDFDAVPGICESAIE